MYTLTAVTVCAVLAQSPWGKPEKCVRFDLPRLSHATVGECYRVGFKEEKRLRRLATETEYIVTRTKIHCDKEPPIFDFSDWK